MGVLGLCGMVVVVYGGDGVYVWFVGVGRIVVVDGGVVGGDVVVGGVVVLLR